MEQASLNLRIKTEISPPMVVLELQTKYGAASRYQNQNPLETLIEPFSGALVPYLLTILNRHKIQYGMSEMQAEIRAVLDRALRGVSSVEREFALTAEEARDVADLLRQAADHLDGSL